MDKWLKHPASAAPSGTVGVRMQTRPNLLKEKSKTNSKMTQKSIVTIYLDQKSVKTNTFGTCREGLVRQKKGDL